MTTQSGQAPLGFRKWNTRVFQQATIEIQDRGVSMSVATSNYKEGKVTFVVLVGRVVGLNLTLLTGTTQDYPTEMCDLTRHEYIFVKRASRGSFFKNITNIVPLGSDGKLGSKFTGERKSFPKLRSVSPRM